MLDLATQLIREEEGSRQFVYDDATGGYIRATSKVIGTPTIGIGRNVSPSGPGLYPAEIEFLLANDVAHYTAQAALLDGFSKLNPVQQAVLVAMVQQMGLGGVRGFHAFCAAIARGDVATAADEGRKSAWDNQVKARAQREMQMLSSGVWVDKK